MESFFSSVDLFSIRARSQLMEFFYNKTVQTLEPVAHYILGGLYLGHTWLTSFHWIDVYRFTYTPSSLITLHFQRGGLLH